MISSISNYFFSYPTPVFQWVAAHPLTALATTIFASAATTAYRSISSYFAKQNSQRRFDQAFAQFPQEEMWRCYIDWSQQEKGADCFDIDEPGYRSAMEKTFCSLRDTLETELTADEFCRLHDLCVSGVQNKQRAHFKLGFSFGAQYNFHPKYTPQIASELVANRQELEDALEEAYEKNIFSGYPNHPRNSERFLGHYDDWGMRSLSSPKPSITKGRLNRLIEEYKRTIRRALTSDEKIRAIVDLCRALEVYHVFADGNQRTIAFVVLQKLLLQNGFPPVILENPVIFDGYCTTEKMRAHIEKGWVRFRRLQDHFLTHKTPPDLAEIDQGISLK